MSDFILSRIVLQTIRQHAGRIDKMRLAELIGCPLHKLEDLCRQHQISLKLDIEEETARR